MYLPSVHFHFVPSCCLSDVSTDDGIVVILKQRYIFSPFAKILQDEASEAKEDGSAFLANMACDGLLNSLSALLYLMFLRLQAQSPLRLDMLFVLSAV